MSKAKRKPWTSEHVRRLKVMAGHVKVPTIARRLRRTEGALRQKALTLRLSLASRS